MDASDVRNEAGTSLAFGPFVLDARRASLTKAGQPVPLRPKALALLSYFAAHPGRVLSKAELLAAVWPGVVVTDDSLSQCVSEVRIALADDQQLIKTVPRRGYLFEPTPAVAGRTRRHFVWAGVALAGALAVVAITWPRREAPHRANPQPQLGPSMAVLPFPQPRDDDDDRGYFAEGVAEDLISELARLPGTLVLARASVSAAAVRQTDVGELARELGVRHVVTARVRRNKVSVEIDARLVSGDSGAVIWSQGFSYSGDSDWAWQRDIVLQVAHALDTSLPTSSALPAQPHGRKLDAIDANMRGHHLVRHAKSLFDLLEARIHFEKALAIDGESASAWAGIAMSYLSEVENGWTTYAESRLALSKPAIDRALSSGPGYFLAHCVKGDLLLARSDFGGAQAAYQQALALNPSQAWAHARMGRVVLGMGRPEEVASPIELALRLNPLQPRHVAWGQFVAGMAQFHLGRNEAAYEHFRKAGAADPNLKWAWLWMAAIDGLDGRSAQAAANLQRVLSLYPIARIGASWKAMYPEVQLHPRLEPGRAHFIEGLRRAGLVE